ncbi:MAG: VWA domain-containing protein [Caldiserica bacterium]|nr:VWA domain-containing protein [Caldisericota bacterium]
MRDKILKRVLGLVCFTLIGLTGAFADGVIIIDPPVRPHPVPIPHTLSVRYHRVQVTIENNIATTTIDQIFKNDSNVDLEGTYIFPLPENAAITRFSMYIDGKKVSGEILDRERARKIYEDIVRRMKDPALLEYVGRNMFRARVYPIPKQGEKRIELVYQETLPYDAGIYKYVYPLDTERFSPRPLKEVSISVKIKSLLPIKNVYSPSHQIDVKIQKFTAECGYEAKNVKPDKDFTLYYTVSEKDVGLNLLTYRKLGKTGYFMLLISPGKLTGKSINKDIVFIIDTSGSMSGNKIKQAKEALRFCINSLNRGDRFNIITFATAVNSYRNKLVPATPKNVNSALEFVAGLEARGGTNIDQALLTGVGIFEETKRPRMIVFLTDGQPTVGVRSVKDILNNLKKANQSEARIFVFGVGNDVNTHLLDRIAEVHRGVTEYVVPGEDIEVKVSSFYRKISEPILSDISLDFGKIKTREIYPSTLPDIFRGTQLVLLGRYEGKGAARIVLKGYVNGREKKFVYQGQFPRENRSDDFIPRIWATRKIGYLMNEIRLKGKNRELVDEIINLSKQYGIITPYTSFLILEKDKDYKRWGITPGVALKVKEEGKKFATGMQKAVGREAVSSAMDITRLKNREIIQKTGSSAVKQVGDKTFYLQENGFWIDAEFKKDAQVKEVKYLSREYFDLLKRNPQLGRYFALGKNLLLVFEGQTYRISE